MTFIKGHSGNIDGRPKGVVDKRAQLRHFLEPHAEKLIEKAIELALEGDSNALRLCIERLIPKAKNESIGITMPNLDMTKTKNLLTVGGEVLNAIANDEITPEQGKLLLETLEIQRKNTEAIEVAEKVTEIHHILTNRNK